MPEPTVDETIEILRGLRERYEIHHKLRYTDEALIAAAHLSYQYIRFLLFRTISFCFFHIFCLLSIDIFCIKIFMIIFSENGCW